MRKEAPEKRFLIFGGYVMRKQAPLKKVLSFSQNVNWENLHLKFFFYSQKFQSASSLNLHTSFNSEFQWMKLWRNNEQIAVY